MTDEKKGGDVAVQGSSLGDAELGQVEAVEQGNPGWNRGLSPRAVIMLSLGGGIGTGLWVGTGTALAAAGPGGIAIAYSLVA